MHLVIVLSALVGAAIFFAGWYLGYWLDHKKQAEVPKKKSRKSRPPKCWVVAPGGPDEEQKKKKRKKRSSSEGEIIAGIDESKIQGTDLRV